MDLIGDAFLSCGCLSYYGPFTGGYRDDLVASWMKRVRQEGIPCSGGGGGDGDEEGGGGGGGDGFSLIGTLGDPVEIRGWQNCALPTDKVLGCLVGVGPDRLASDNCAAIVGLYSHDSENQRCRLVRFPRPYRCSMLT